MAGAFDIAEELKGMKFSIACSVLIIQYLGLRRELLKLMNDLDEEEQDECQGPQTQTGCTCSP